MKKLNNRQTKNGFTLVEVTLVTAFVSMLVIAIALIFTQISAIFQKGLTLKAVNSVGRNLVSEFTTTINSAPSIDSVSLCNMYISESEPTKRNECKNEGAFRYLYNERLGMSRETVEGGEDKTVQYFGAFCTGHYTYLWNTYYGIKEGYTLRLKYKTDESNEHTLPEGPNDSPFQLVRFVDRNYNACTQLIDQSYKVKNFWNDEQHPEIDMTILANGAPYYMSAPQEGFLESSESNTNLDLYEFVIFPASQDAVTLRAFFAGTFILATNNGTVNIVRGGEYCDPTSNGVDTSGNLFDLGSGFNYCGINKFNFAARTAGSSI